MNHAGRLDPSSGDWKRVDLPLWSAIRKIMPAEKPDSSQFPAKIGVIDNVSVYLVDGDVVKRKYRMDFIEGGHDLVYGRFIPKRQIWLDGHQDLHELPFILYHEVYERRLMEREKKSYNDAHIAANRAEKIVRSAFAREPR